MSDEESVARLGELLARLESAQGELEKTDDPERAITILGELSDLAREVQAEIERARREAADASA